MIRKVPYPPQEEERIESLRSYEVLDSSAESNYDDIVALAASICNTPMAVISLIDVDRQWFKAKVGVEVTETPRDLAFCSYTVCGNRPLVIENASTDPIFHDHPLVTGGINVRFYAGVPLLTGEGHALGSLCVIDTVPKVLSDRELEALKKLGKQVISLLELRKSESLLRKSNDRIMQFDRFFNLSPDVFTITDMSGRFIAMNPALTNAIGYTDDELAKIPYLEIVHQDDRQRTAGSATALRLGQPVTNFENRYLAKDGSVKWFTWSALFVASEGLVYAAGKNITEIKEKELLIEEQRAHMLAASKLASLGEMAGGVAHEINTPLNAILFCAEQIQSTAKEIENEEVQELGGLVGETAQRISKIVKGLRAFARDGSFEEPETAEVQIVIEQALSLGRERIAQNGIELKVSYPTASCFIDCRSVQIGQVVLNLLNNAFDAVVGKPEPWISIDVAVLQEKVRIEVSDSGPGLPPEVRAKLFQPFFTTKGVGKGTGIGLSISKGIIESHDGSLFFDFASSNTKFIIELPVSALVIQQIA